MGINGEAVVFARSALPIGLATKTKSGLDEISELSGTIRNYKGHIRVIKIYVIEVQEG